MWKFQENELFYAVIFCINHIIFNNYLFMCPIYYENQTFVLIHLILVMESLKICFLELGSHEPFTF